ncbi:MAG TPA: DNA-directed RNA polymerase subunit alpha [Dehalococcoidia bacterium]|nr:DNA-directed RNA polymerase subunit alpha [Dehalococcoidia bacterium]
MTTDDFSAALAAAGRTPLTQLESPQLQIEEATDTYARVVAEPLQSGFGTTLGNALRRVLLSSLPGAAVSSVRIDEVEHEFSIIPNMKEDTTEFLLNLKEVRLRAFSDRPGKLYLEAAGSGPVTASAIQPTADYEIANPELYLATLDGDQARLTVELNVERGTGYVPAGAAVGMPIGVIPVDAIFTPVRKVNYTVQHTRVGQMTNYDRLILEVWTDGTLTGVEAISQSSDILSDYLHRFSVLGKPVVPAMERGLGIGSSLPPDRYNTPIEDLNLSVRAYNCLKRSGLMTVGQVLEKSEDELLSLRNFGRKSYDELRERLVELDFLEPSDLEGGAAGELPAHFEPDGEEPAQEFGSLGAALMEALRGSGGRKLESPEESEDEDTDKA